MAGRADPWADVDFDEAPLGKNVRRPAAFRLRSPNSSRVGTASSAPALVKLDGENVLYVVGSLSFTGADDAVYSADCDAVPPPSPPSLPSPPSRLMRSR